MPAPLIGFALMLGVRVVPVLLRTGSIAMRYIVTSPGTKGNTLRTIIKRALGRDSVVDDIAKLTTKSKSNPIIKIIDPKKLSTLERDTLMQTTYRNASKILQKQPSYPLNTKLAGNIEKGLHGKFDKVFASRNFVAGDRTIAAVAKATEKLAKAPKQLPKPGAVATAAKATAEAGKIATQVAKSRISSGMGVTKQIIKQVPKADRKQIIKLQRATEKIKKAATGTETGPVISEGLRGVGTAPKPAWWQGTIPSWLRVGGKAYEGAYPGAVSAERILGYGTGGTFAGGLLFAGGSAIHGAIQEAGLEFEGPPEITTEQLMSELAEDYKNSYDSTITKDSTNVILPSAVE